LHDLKLGIDSWSYHRYLGKISDTEPFTGIRWTTEQFLNRAKDLGAQGVSLETILLESTEGDYISKLRVLLDRFDMKRILAWVHPEFALSARNNVEKKKTVDDLRSHFDLARKIGTEILRIEGSKAIYRYEPHKPRLDRLAKTLKGLAEEAESYGLRLAYENHIDFTSDEIVGLIEKVGSESLRVNFDTGNQLRMFEDPLDAAKKLAPYAIATHVKDLDVVKYGKFYSKRVTPRDLFFWASVPLGDGIIDIPAIIQVLHDSGYTGLYAVEIDRLKEGCESEDKAVEKSLNYLRNLRI
jgi:sugar phosphate isomerase/epimerase